MVNKSIYRLLLKAVASQHVHLYRTYGTEIRVRFAPSPTGHLHLGGLRTALYNYLFARSKGGIFVVRVEDTDQTRIVPDSVEKLLSDLEWAGIAPDEGPDKGGPYGPYTQSERLQLYRDQIQVLLQNGSAYHCFCSTHRLDLLRREALRARQIPRYDNRCRHLSREETEKRLERGDVSCIRFKLGSFTEPFDDLVYGLISCSVSENEGDPVIIKTDGFPTYHFANVVDDHFMKISHVLRGVEWQVSTPKHIQLYRAFGWEPPKFAHLPLILNSDGTKLSKRQGDIRVQSYKDAGILPLALLNFVISAGGGFTKTDHQSKLHLHTLDELVNQFNLDVVNSNSCRLSERLLDFNRLELTRQIQDAHECQSLTKNVKELVNEVFKDRLDTGALQLDDEHIKSVLSWSKKRIHKLTDLTKNDLAFLWVLPSSFEFQHTHQPPNTICILRDLKQRLMNESVEFNQNQLKSLLISFSKEKQLPFSILMKLLRQTLSGLKEGPGVAEMMEILGQARVVGRLERAADILEKQTTSVS